MAWEPPNCVLVIECVVTHSCAWHHTSDVAACEACVHTCGRLLWVLSHGLLRQLAVRGGSVAICVPLMWQRCCFSICGRAVLIVPCLYAVLI